MLKSNLFKIGIFLLCFLSADIYVNNADADLSKKRNKIGVLYWHGDATEKKIALTFDDGPNEPYTSQILNTLKTYNVKATFFLIGKNVELYPEVVKRMVGEGHSIGNHTYSHPDLALELKFQIKEQIEKAEKAIFNAAGIRPFLFRPPYGLDNPWVFMEAEKMGYLIIKWSVSGHNGYKDVKADKLIKIILNSVENGSIILLHDGKRLAKNADRSQVIKALPVIIESLQQKGYQFVTVPELLGLESRERPRDYRITQGIGGIGGDSQATTDLGLWEEIESQPAVYNNQELCQGGLIHELNDESWKVGSYHLGLGDLIDYKSGKHSFDEYNYEGIFIIDKFPPKIFRRNFESLS